MSLNLYAGNVLISSPGMYQMAEDIILLLQKHNANFVHIKAEYTTFPNGEIKPFIPETVRGMHAFLLHDLQYPDPNVNLIQMLLIADALKRASVIGISLVIPYIPYMRQDRKDKPRVSISARLIADLIEVNKKIVRVITLDLHTDQEQGFFSIPVDNINAMLVHAEYFKEKFNGDLSKVTVVAPDFGSAVRAERFASRLGNEVPITVIQKKRSSLGHAEATGYVDGPSVEGRIVIIYDDMIDTGGTNRVAVEKILSQGAREVYTCVTHGIFSNNAEDKFREAARPVVVTPSIPRTNDYKDKNATWLHFVPIEPLIAKTIYEASIVGGSMSKLSN